MPDPLELREELAFALDDVLSTRILPRLPRPAVVNLIRSPGYVPTKYLSELECRVLDALSDVYGVGVVSHERRVDVSRTGCERAFEYAVVG